MKKLLFALTFILSTNAFANNQDPEFAPIIVEAGASPKVIAVTPEPVFSPDLTKVESASK